VGNIAIMRNIRNLSVTAETLFSNFCKE
jgi:hypothetical protein